MPPSPDLPPFGIRDLLGPGQSPGLIQITAGQYDATLKSQPDSSLTYLDEDDGDLITIGSSFELSQRLEEPVPQALRYSLISTVNPLDGNLVHVFDIKHSSCNLAVWREHEAHSSKKLRQPHVADTSPPSVNSEERKPKILGRRAALKYYDIDPETTISRLYEIFALSGKVVRIRPYLDDQGQSQGSGFVLFASEAQANQALKELNGCSIDGRSLKLCKLSSKQSTEEQSSVSTTIITPEVSEDQIETYVESKSEETGPEPAPVTAEMIISGIEEHLGGLADILQLAANTLQKAANKSRETETSVIEDVLKGVKGILTEVGNFGSEVFKVFEAEANKALDVPVPQESQMPPRNQTQTEVNNPIEETPSENVADDTPSYDPTQFGYSPIANDEQHLNEPDTEDVPQPVAQSWKPSSPIPIIENQVNQYGTKSKTSSILDDETEDADFTARYPPLMSVRRAQTVSGTAQRGRYRPYKRRSMPAENPGVPEWTRPSVRFDDRGVNQTENNPQNLNDEKLDAAESFYRTLPGAWPEGKPEQSGSNLPTSSESSGAFFDRMVGRDRSSNSPFPFDQGRGPRRYNTTASSNPASRLNKPFDPGFVYALKGPYENGSRTQKDFSHETSQQSFKPWSFNKVATNPSWRPPHLRQGNLERFSFQRPAARFSQTTDQIAPSNSSQTQGFTHAKPRHFRSVPNFKPNSETEAPLSDAFSFNDFPPAPSFDTHPVRAQPVDKVETCVAQLKTLGFGTNDRNMANRLHVYAVAADGDISQAVEMIEEDREAIRGLQV